MLSMFAAVSISLVLIKKKDHNNFAILDHFGRNKSISLISRIMFPHWLSEGLVIRE